MGKLFDLYRSGHNRGIRDGYAGRRRRAEWELGMLTPLTWLPGVNSESYVQGYHDGFALGISMRNGMRELVPE